MLSTSPVLSSSSPNASPSGFRQRPAAGPVRSPRSSRRPSLSMPRHASAASLSSPVTAAKSPTPSRSSDSAAQPGPSRASQQQNPQEPPPPLRPEPMSTPRTASPSAAAPDTAQSQVDAPSTESSSAPDRTLSAHKRRGSSIDIAAEKTSQRPESDATLGELSPQASKRARPDERPPKVLPRRYELCAVVDVVELISYMLSELIATNDAIRTSNGGLTRFHSRTAPGISVRDYLHRLARHATLTQPLLLVIVYYIDRLCAMYQDFNINTLTVHRFLITAATVASKGLSDSFWNNSTYARVGGVRLAELKLLEQEFLYRMDWRVVPNPEVLVAYYFGLVERTPGYVLELDGSSEDDAICEDSGDDEHNE